MRKTFADGADRSDLSIPRSRDPNDFADYLCRAHAAGIEVDFSQGNIKLWAVALDCLMKANLIEVASVMAPRLAQACPDVSYFRTMAALFELLPPPCDDASFAAFRDDVGKEVQIVRRGGANCVILGFCGRAHALGMPVDMIHRWFGQLGAHVIYLRDYQGHNYDQGIASLSSDMSSTLRILREQIANLGAKRIVCYGNSLGTYGALRYALELQAEAVLAFAGPTNLVPGFGKFAYLERNNVEPGLDLRPLYQQARYAPRVHIVYGEHHAFDRVQAANFLGLPTVTLEMARGWSSHAVFLHTVFVGRYEPLIRWLVDPDRTAGQP